MASPLFADGVKKERIIRVNIIKEKGNYLKNTESRYVKGFFLGGGGGGEQSEATQQDSAIYRGGF